MRLLLTVTHASSLPSSPSPPPAVTAIPASTPPLSPRPAVILPGLGNNTGDYQGLASALKDRAIPSVVVARVSRLDWLRNAAGLRDPNYWRGTLCPRPVLDWYLRKVESAVSEAKQLAKGGSVSLIGHSAGGWLARLYMEESGNSDISLLLTLGTPHLPPPKGVQGVIDQTRGLLDYVEKNCSPAVYSSNLKFVCIAGRYIKGARLIGNPNLSQELVTLDDKDQYEIESADVNNIDKPVPPPPMLRARFIGQGYKQVCGRADVWGDGVVPEMSAHLEGALNISLDGVYHSPVGSNDVQRPWYGSPAVLDKWVHHLLS
uniref:GPI inositol-deacylase n=1 Tax=Anthurium amnicola TaxID=1678845 RepID=A0A1D1YVW7_9ARAE